METIRILHDVWIVLAAITGVIGVAEFVHKIIKREWPLNGISVTALLCALLLWGSYLLYSSTRTDVKERAGLPNDYLQQDSKNEDNNELYVLPHATSLPEWFSQALPYIPSEGITPECSNKKSIMWVQQTLRKIGYGEIAVDGKWEAQTNTAVSQFERDYGYAKQNVVTYEMACHMLRLYLATDSPLRYITIYCN